MSSDIRVYDGAGGRYLHAEDLARAVEDARLIADPVFAIFLPTFADFVRLIAAAAASTEYGRDLTPEEAARL